MASLEVSQFDLSVQGLVTPLLMALREGRYQRTLSLIAGFSGLMSGIEVTAEHYKGSYGQKVMYSPVIITGILACAGTASSIKPRFTKKLLGTASWLLILDGVIGFGFHVRGVARKPGGWNNTVFNIVMGPPIFAPLLLGIGGFLGLVACRLNPEESSEGLEREERTRLKMELCWATAISASLNGFESLYSHYKGAFAFRSQWIPIILTPPLIGAAVVSVRNDRIAKTILPVLSTAAIVAGSIGFYYHVQSSLKRPGGKKLYNMIYGPPPLAPLLFAATGLIGLLASQMAYVEESENS